MQDLERSIKDLEQARNEISQLQAAREPTMSCSRWARLGTVGGARVQLHNLEARCHGNRLLPHDPRPISI